MTLQVLKTLKTPVHTLHTNTHDSIIPNGQHVGTSQTSVLGGWVSTQGNIWPEKEGNAGALMNPEQLC